MIKRNHIVLLLAFIILSASFGYAQNKSVKIKYNGKEKSIPSFVKNGIVFVPINDLAEGLGINYFYNKSVQKTELKFKNFNLKFSGNNPFVVKTRKGEIVDVIQLPVPAGLSGNRIFVPLEAVLTQFQSGLNTDFEFNEDAMMLMQVKPSTKAAAKPNVKADLRYSKKVTGNTEKQETEKKEIEKTKTEKQKPEEVKYGLFKIAPKKVKPVEQEEPDKSEKENKTVSGEETAKSSSDENGAVILNEKANGTLITIKLRKKGVKYESVYKNGAITLTLKNGPKKFDEVNNIPSKSVVRKVRFKQNGKQQVIQFEVGKGYDTFEIATSESGSEILLTIRNKAFIKSKNAGQKDKWDFNTVVIDAGHGGKDIGAVGIGGLREKDVNLAIALKLGKMIERNVKDVKVVYTRRTDEFVELDKRGKIANEKNGKLFISIHCNSTPQKPTDASGAEIYLLRPGRTESAIKIAERENSVIKFEDNPSRYKKLTDENFILVSMAHSSYMKYSEKFSDYLHTDFMNVSQLKCRGIKQAGFYVLVGASMPGVLVETGFISNKNDAHILGSIDGQNRIANAIYESVKKFKDYYDKAMEADS